MNFCIMLLFDTGMRCNEMILMEPEDIKPDYILVKHGKGSKERVVPKSPALSKQLMKYRTTGSSRNSSVPWTQASFGCGRYLHCLCAPESADESREDDSRNHGVWIY